MIGSHLRFIGHLLYRNLIIELNKLFSTSKNDKLALVGILKEAYNFEQNSEIEISKNILNQFEDQINRENQRILIIKNLRDKLYAHTDLIKIEELDTEISFAELCKLVDIAKEIVRYLYIVFLKADFMFHPLNFDRERFILFDLMVKGESQRIKEIYHKYGLTTSE